MLLKRGVLLKIISIPADFFTYSFSKNNNSIEDCFQSELRAVQRPIIIFRIRFFLLKTAIDDTNAPIHLEVCDALYELNRFEDYKVRLHDNARKFIGKKVSAFLNRIVVVCEKRSCGA